MTLSSVSSRLPIESMMNSGLFWSPMLRRHFVEILFSTSMYIAFLPDAMTDLHTHSAERVLQVCASPENV